MEDILVFSKFSPSGKLYKASYRHSLPVKLGNKI